MAKSPQEFRKFEKNYIHRVQPVSDSGIELELLQKYIYVSLDIFRRVRQNKPIETEIEAWLAQKDDELQQKDSIIAQLRKRLKEQE